MTIGIRYSASFDAQAETAVVDFFEIVAPSDAVLLIEQIHVSQETEEADAQAEMLTWAVIRGHTTSGSGGNASTEVAWETGGPAAGATVEDTNTTVATGGSPATLWRDAFHVAQGIHWFAGESPFVVSPSQRLVVRLEETPADSITWSGTIVWRELGG